MLHKKCAKSKRRRKRRVNRIQPEPKPVIKLPDVVDPTVLLVANDAGD